MPAVIVRKNAEVIRWLGGALFAALMVVALRAMPFYPPWLIALLALAAGALALSSPPLAALLFVAACGPPVLAVDFVVGVLFLIIGFSATQYLGADRAQGFVAIVLALIAIPFGAEWAVAAVTGYYVGRGRGAVAAFMTSAVIIVTGVLTGVPVLGRVITGGAEPPLLVFDRAPDAALSFGWVTEAVASADPGAVLEAFASVSPVAPLMILPIVWAAAGAIAAAMRGPEAGPKAVAGVLASIAVLAAGTTVVDAAFGSAIGLSAIAVAAVTSAAAGTAAVILTEWLFPLTRVERAQPVKHGVSEEDADVDDLLRLIASAEEQIATKHRTHAVVLLTDMKSFSAMTESVGSIESAKRVQRQRDTLMPLIDRFGGKGKSTGGDGLVAAFTDPRGAIDTAIEMQRVLERLRATEPGLRDLAIRIGIADGEVVCDKGGRPFIGAALNLAARVMDVADGGRIMATANVAGEAGLPVDQLWSHGAFKLKNIAEPVSVIEVFWAEGQEPQPVRIQ
jgi:class 3 adenylate cyclase